MYKLIVTELAYQDLDNIVSYIAVQLANQVDEDAKKVSILRFFYSAQDYSKLI